jgi:hypothetical protein
MADKLFEERSVVSRNFGDRLLGSMSQELLGSKPTTQEEQLLGEIKRLKQELVSREDIDTAEVTGLLERAERAEARVAELEEEVKRLKA